MNYEFLVNGDLILSGSLLTLTLAISGVLLTLILIAKVTWRKIKTYETLKYEFVTIIAHKFRTPLSQIKWLLETILEKETDPYIKENLKTLGESNSNLINLTNTLVEITDSVKGSGTLYNFEKTNICDFTSQVVNGLKDEFHNKNLFISVQCEEPEIFTRIDQPRMAFVLETILENSIHYSSPGKNVEVEIYKNRRKACIEVRDHGIGIDPKDIPNVFSKFWRSQQAEAMDTEGFGIGLYLAESIAKRHRGKITVESPGLERGTIFTVILPRY